jgi:hypothetical protein
MKIVITRAFAIVIAVMCGIVMMRALTLAGDKTHGPLENALLKVSETVVEIEQKVLAPTTNSRKESLNWLSKRFDSKEKWLNPDTILLGAYDNESIHSYKTIVQLEDALQTKFPIIQIYTAWGSGEKGHLPLTRMRAIHKIGSIPLLTWEPWLSAFDAADMPKFSDANTRDKGGLKAIAQGDYDGYIAQRAEEAKAYGKPFFLRLGHEMNDPYRYPWGPQNNASEDFIKAWQHVVDKFRQSGADNVIWVWSPHPAYLQYEAYFPGDTYVDWVGVPTLNYGSVAPWSKWWTFQEIFGNYYDRLATFGKPIMITELGCLDVGGNRADWYKDVFEELPQRYPSVKSVLFFHSNDDNTTTYKSLNWQFKMDKRTLESIEKAVNGWKL